MKKSRILTLVLTIALVAVMAISLFACNDKCTEHVDEDNDFKCDNCGEKISNDNNVGDTTTDDGKEEYTFILRDTDLNPVEGASVMVNVNGTNDEVKTTDANGTVVFRVRKGAMLVMVEVLEVPEEYDIDQTIFRFEEGKLLTSNAAVKKDVYQIKVVDQNGDAVEGVQVQLCFGETCMATKPFTDVNGQASYAISGYSVENAYVSINAVPNGYALKDGEKLNLPGATDYTHYDDFDSEKTITIEIVKLNMATVTVGGFFSNFSDIEVKVYDAETDALVTTVVTGADGKATFPIYKEISYKVGNDTIYNYYLIAKHVENDPRYVWGYREEGVQDLTSNNMLINFTFLNKVNYTVNVDRTNQTLSVEGIRVVFYNRLFEEVASAETDATGVASLSMIPYDVYFIKTENVGEAATPLYKIEKNGVTNHNILINDNLVLGSEQAPIDLVYGFNSLPALNVNDKIYCKVVNPQGATLVIEGADVIVVDEEENQYQLDDGKVKIGLGASDQILLIEARENLGYWGASVELKGISGANELIKETEIDGEVSVNLVNGKYYYTFEADDSTATLTLSSSNDVSFEIEGVATNKAVIAKGDTINFAVIGEGQATFNISYAPAYYDYVVNITKEIIGLENDLTASGIEVDLVYNGNVVASAVSKNGTATFKNIQEYPIHLIKADIKNLPANYIKFYENADGSYFAMQDYDTDGLEGADKWQYETYFALSLSRVGSQELPYLWASEGQSNAPAYAVSVSESGEAYIEATWSSRNLTEQAPAFYYVFVAGNYNLACYNYNLIMENYNFTNPRAVSEYDATKNASVLQVPLDLRLCIKITAPQGDVKLRWGTEVLDLTSGDAVATGTSDNPFALVFSQTINTPDFIEGTSIDNPGVSEYYYTYTVVEAMSIQVINIDATITVFVDDVYTELVDDVFAVEAGEVVTIRVSTAKEYGDENILDGVSFAVKGV